MTGFVLQGQILHIFTQPDFHYLMYVWINQVFIKANNNKLEY